MKRGRKRKCHSCGKFYQADCRNGRHQHYCSSAPCRKASKAAAQAKWRASSKGRDYFGGPDQVARVRDWRAQHPGYWRGSGSKSPDALQDLCSVQSVDIEKVKPSLGEDTLQDLCLLQPPLIVGLISALTGNALQDDIAGSLRRMHARGQQILGMEPGIEPKGDDQHDHQAAC